MALSRCTKPKVSPCLDTYNVTKSALKNAIQPLHGNGLSHFFRSAETQISLFRLNNLSLKIYVHRLNPLQGKAYKNSSNILSLFLVDILKPYVSMFSAVFIPESKTNKTSKIRCMEDCNNVLIKWGHIVEINLKMLANASAVFPCKTHFLHQREFTHRRLPT